MTAEFSSNGFLAVASFFGKTEEDIRKDAQQEEEESSKQEKVKFFNKRLGVGANQKKIEEGKKNQEMLSSATKKKIMSIGRRNKRKLDDDDDDDDENHYYEDGDEMDDEKIEKNYHESDDDDDEGRTSAVKAKVISKSQNNTIPHQGVVGKKKKKKSKKERQRELEKLENKMKDENGNVKLQYEQEQGKQSKDNKHMTDGKIDDSNVENSGEKPKKKRRKVRSKQKNVRKDNRPNFKKPDHLQIGSASYQGRPLTKETRAFMNLPLESKTSRMKQRRIDLKNANDATNELNSNDLDQGQMNLGIDDFLGSPTATEMTTSDENIRELKNDENVPVSAMYDSGELIMNIDKTPHKDKEEQKYENKSKITKEKKKKKSKYKNLK